MADSPIPPLAQADSLDELPEPQPVVEQQGMAAHFIVLNIAPGPAAEDAVRAFFGNAGGLVRSVGRRQPELDLTMVVGIGAKAWDRLFGAPRPAGLHEFRELRGAKHHAPSTPGDLLLHIRAQTVNMGFELAMQSMRALDSAVQPVDEVHGFRYFDARAMIGFVDGTENPEGREALEATLIGAEDPDFAGGSYVIVQKYMHDIARWEAMSVEQQERVIGRHKLSDIEFADADKASFAHNVLTNIEDAEGNQLEILRDNMPFGSPSRGDMGTYFIGYAREPGRIETMLDNMFVGNPPGNYDRILDVSTAVTGCLFFVPTADMLDVIAEGGTLAAPAPEPAPAKAPDGSLGIGGLKPGH